MGQFASERSEERIGNEQGRPYRPCGAIRSCVARFSASSRSALPRRRADLSICLTTMDHIDSQRLRILILEANPFARTLYEQRARVRASRLMVETVSTIAELFTRLGRPDASYDLVVCDGPRGAEPTVAALPAVVEELVRRQQAVAVLSDRRVLGL